MILSGIVGSIMMDVVTKIFLLGCNDSKGNDEIMRFHVCEHEIKIDCPMLHEI